MSNTFPNDTTYPTRSEGVDCLGLTKREHFASLVLQGLVSSQTREEDTMINSARIAICYADILIEELNKE